MTRDRLWLALAILLPALAATIASMSTVDLAYQVRAGELMLESLSVLRTDPFTFTAMGDPWLNQQWGAGVLFALVHGLGGWGGLALLRAVLVAAAGSGSCCSAAAAGCRRARPRCWGWPASSSGSPPWACGPSSSGSCCFAAVLAILAWRDRQPRLSWAIPLRAAWANLHGSFFLGPAAVAIALAQDLVARRPGVPRLLAVLAASARRGPRHPVRCGGVGVRGRDRDEPGDHAPDH